MTDKERADLQAVKNAMDGYIAAVNAVFDGNPDPMREIYSHQDDVTCMPAEGGVRVGWDQVFEDWRTQAKNSRGGHVELDTVQVSLGKDTAVANATVHGDFRHSDGSSENFSLRQSNVFRKEDGHWKMIAHHVDPLKGWSEVPKEA